MSTLYDPNWRDKPQPLRDVPYGENEYDCDFTVGEMRDIDGKSIFGVIWYAGGESWSWSEYKTALAHARISAEQQEDIRELMKLKKTQPNAFELRSGLGRLV